jgi:hypothetical protein
MPTINTIITREDVNVADKAAVFEVIRDAVIGPFLDACPSGVTAEVREFDSESRDLYQGWEVRIDVSKATAPIVARHEGLNAIGAGVHSNAAYGVQREVVRGYGSDIQLAYVRLVPSRGYGNAPTSYDLTVTVAALAVGSDDRNQHVSTTEDKAFSARTIRVASIKAAAKKQGTAIYDALLAAQTRVAHLEATAAQTIAHRTATAEIKAAVKADHGINVEWSNRHDATTGTLSFPYLTPADALRILEAVKALSNPASAR